MKKLLLFEFDDNFEPPEYVCEDDNWDECHCCPFFHWNDENGFGYCRCNVANAFEQQDDEELEELGEYYFKCPLYDIFYD